MKKCLNCRKEYDETTKNHLFSEYFCSERCNDVWDWECKHEQINADKILCPYCGHELDELDSNSVFDFKDGEMTITCGKCGKEFNCERVTEVTYVSQALEKYYEEKNDE